MHITLNHKMFVDIFHMFHMFFSVCVFETKNNTVPENGKQNDSREKTSFFVSRANQRKRNGVARNDVAEERRRAVWGGFFGGRRRITRDLQKNIFPQHQNQLVCPKTRIVNLFCVFFYLNCL